jgi:hypothetical protein
MREMRREMASYRARVFTTAPAMPRSGPDIAAFVRQLLLTGPLGKQHTTALRIIAALWQRWQA